MLGLSTECSAFGLGHARPMIGVWATATARGRDDRDSRGRGRSLRATQSNVWIAVAASVVVELSSPILTARWMRWYWGSLAGLPLGAIVLFCFFFVRPHAWQPSRLDAWKSVGMFVGLYPEIIVPACIIAGALGGHLAHRLRQAHASP